MIEFTILLDDTAIEFEPSSSNPDLQFLLSPTARIGRDDSVVHLAPIPVHAFFNAIAFGRWLQGCHAMSENDAFVTYCIHDMFKSLFRFRPAPNQPSKRRWPHQRHLFFQHIEAQLEAQSILDDFDKSFRVAEDHGQRGVAWREATSHEKQLDAGTEERGKHWEWDWPLVGLTIRQQAALSNVLGLAHVKHLFVESYVEAVRAEYPDVFARYAAVSYQYEFVDPASLSDNIDQDLEALCRQSSVQLVGQRLCIRTFIGAHGSHWTPGQETRVRLPFWLLLTLREDPVSVLFPVPTLLGSDGQVLDNPAFVERVREGFHRRVRALLEAAQVGAAAKAKWMARVDDIMAGIDDTFHLVHTTVFEDTANARRVDRNLPLEPCSMCGSLVPASFTCSPVADLGANVSNYTDWHLGDAGKACVLCAISHFKTPEALEPARKLIFQRKLVYFATSTPSATPIPTTGRARLPFSTAAPFEPKLEIRSLESLVTLNVIAALFLHDALRRAVYHHNNEPDLWLERKFSTDPFSFVGEIAAAKSKGRMPVFLATLFKSLNRSIVLLDPLLPMRIEVPFHALACLWGVSKGRHFQLKYKPLIVSNETAVLPVIWDGYHSVDENTLMAIETLQTFVEAFRHPRISHRMKLAALAASPEEFIETLMQLGGFNYETVLARLAQLSPRSGAHAYLGELRKLIVQTPLVREIWG
jgi:hypothetical protein